MKKPNNLIIVCCHAIYLGGATHGHSEDEWSVWISAICMLNRSWLIFSRLIESFQKGETPTFINHAQAGLKALSEDPDSLLIFSG